MGVFGYKKGVHQNKRKKKNITESLTFFPLFLFWESESLILAF